MGQVARLRLLIVDDNAQLASVVMHAMSRTVDATTASSASAALGLIKGGQRYDAILCDVRMPGMTGIELYARLVSVAPDQAERMIFMTGDRDGASEIRLQAPRSLGSIVKPFSIADLQGRLLH